MSEVDKLLKEKQARVRREKAKADKEAAEVLAEKRAEGAKDAAQKLSWIRIEHVREKIEKDDQSYAHNRSLNYEQHSEHLTRAISEAATEWTDLEFPDGDRYGAPHTEKHSFISKWKPGPIGDQLQRLWDLGLKVSVKHPYYDTYYDADGNTGDTTWRQGWLTVRW